MSTTVSEIKLLALQELGVLQIGQSADAQDATTMQDAYDGVYAILKEKGLATWVSTGPIPDTVKDQVAVLMAFSKTNIYAVSEKRYARIAVKAQNAIPSIQALVSPAHESMDDPVDY